MLTITKVAPAAASTKGPKVITEADGSKTHYLGQVPFTIGPSSVAQPKG